ncbi:MAG: type II toxin-antitoxin system Phd/YefM family antitoxin [Bryobacteraceae bacterium]
MVFWNIAEAKSELSTLIDEVQKGGEVILAREGKPVAKLMAYRKPTEPRKPGSMAGEIWIADDFDELPPEIAEAFGAAEPNR